ncbi:MAG: polymorphic toxin type 50 domain-containing protein [Chlamydiales bacterium]|nr:polymorphic toxin type 50 domain-containing protein [Chlamydiales bacterium]
MNSSHLFAWRLSHNFNARREHITFISKIKVCFSATEQDLEHLLEFSSNFRKDRRKETTTLSIKECTKECKRLIKSFEALPDYERGKRIGYILGKFGTDIYAGSAAIKAVAAYQKLREANRLLIFETMTVSNANKERIVVAATEHCTKRSDYFKTVKLEWDKQNKHIAGKHNFVSNKSIWTHKDPEGLLKQHAGKGQPANSLLPGSPGYRERIDFQEVIGYHFDKNTQVSQKTTIGIVHYSKNGAHIVPTKPKV